MADDLEAFLRQAAQRRAQRQKPAQPKPPPARPQTQPPRSPATPQRPPVSSPVVEAVVIPSLVQSRVDTSGFERRAEQLGEEVGLADEAMEAHLQQKFDHQVGTLSDVGHDEIESSEVFDPAGESGATAAADIVAMLKNPNTVRQAVLLSEILSPPHHRW